MKYIRNQGTNEGKQMYSNQDGHQYEKRCADVLRKRGFRKVEVTRESGDQGVDIIAFKNGKKYGIQCKYYTSPVGNKAVQEAFAGAKFYDCDIAAVMTNNTFTKSAKDLAFKTNVLLWEKEKITPTLKDKPIKNKTSLFHKFSKIVNGFMICVGFMALLFLTSPNGIKFTTLQKIQSIFIICGGLLGFLGWYTALTELIAVLLYFFCIIVSILLHILLKNPNSIVYELLVYLIPLSICFARTIQLKDSISRWKYNKALKNYARAYISIISQKLDSEIKLIETKKTEYGYINTYHSSFPVPGKLYRLQEEFNKNLNDKYEFSYITDNDFIMKVYSKH